MPNDSDGMSAMIVEIGKRLKATSSPGLTKTGNNNSFFANRKSDADDNFTASPPVAANPDALSCDSRDREDASR